ncbi:MAG: serine/threonine-protein kinase PknK [Deltaproteobacteria bacterium]|nr:serine/threonine-protein kinase PknK [Deltaproteobacteria bacterium]
MADVKHATAKARDAPHTRARKGAAPAPGTHVSERVRLLRRLGGGGMSELWVAEHLTLGIDVAVKFLLRPDDTSARDRLAREALLTARIDHPHAVRVFDRGETEDGTPFIVMELIEGESLANRLERAGALSLDDVVRLVSQVAEVLSVAHAQGIIHRDIKPDNIMLVAGTEELFAKVVDFGIAKPIEATGSMQVTGEGHVVGTPLYMAPEQLLDAQPADARSDLWGLGLVAYESLVAHRPFTGKTRAAIGLAMALRRFEPVTTERPELPAGLDDWFDRALRMDPKDRFESADELKRSLVLAVRGGDPALPHREQQRARLRIPATLYGRERELGAVRSAFARAAGGRSQVLLVAGYPGIGKTSLIATAQQSLVGSSGVFVSGKFDQFDRGTPYQSLVQAFRKLIRASLGGGRETLGAWKERIATGLGESGRVLVDVIPELEEVLGSSKSLEPVSRAALSEGGIELRNRFQVAMGHLVATLASPEHTLVLFVDDLQWADLPSIDLVTSLATDPESRHVLLIGAYRDSEVDDAHPLTAAIERMRSVGAAFDEIVLGPLGEDAVLDLVSDTFPGAPGRARLAAACRAKTLGNAFFLKRFLESLHEEGALRYSAAEQRWTWDQSSIEARAVGQEVVDFVRAEIRRMPRGTREALEVAACIGDPFDLETLAYTLGDERLATLELLRPALATELVTAVPDASLEMARVDEESRLALRFAHDRVRQAARSSMDEEAAVRVHRKVGLYLLDRLEGAAREQRLFELVEHLNRGAAAQSASEQAQLCALNLAAARRASASAAFEPAYGYFQKARALLGPTCWSTEYEQALAIHVEGARAAYLSGDYATMEALVESAVANGRQVLDRVGAREVAIQSFVSQQHFADAVRSALDVLRELGTEIPAEPSGAYVEQAVVETLALLSSWSAERLDALPMASDPRIAAMQRIQNGTMSSAYLAAPSLLPVLACNIVRSTLEHGVCKESPYGFAIFALVLSAINQIDVAYSVGKTAMRMLDRVGDRSLRPKMIHVVGGMVGLFVEPMRASIEADRRAARLGFDTGDHEYAAWGLHSVVCNAFYAGIELAELGKMYEKNAAILVHRKQLAALGCTVQYGQAVRNLTGAAADPTRLVGPEYDETRHMDELRAINFRGAAFIVTVVGTFIRYLFRDIEGALELADRGAEYADGATSTYHPVWFHQYRTLATLGSLDTAAEEADVARALERIEASVRQLRTWQRFAPANHDHRVHLVDAEIARVSGRRDAALEHYDAAASSAGTHGFVHEEALAHELAGRLHRSSGDHDRARARLLQACAAYDRWGATAKSAQLRDELTQGAG